MHGSARASAPPADPFAAGSDAADGGYGPEVTASRDGECDAYPCYVGGLITEGDAIRADGEGGWVHSECVDE